MQKRNIIGLILLLVYLGAVAYSSESRPTRSSIS